MFVYNFVNRWTKTEILYFHYQKREIFAKKVGSDTLFIHDNLTFTDESELRSILMSGLSNQSKKVFPVRNRWLSIMEIAKSEHRLYLVGNLLRIKVKKLLKTHYASAVR